MCDYCDAFSKLQEVQTAADRLFIWTKKSPSNLFQTCFKPVSHTHTCFKPQTCFTPVCFKPDSHLPVSNLIHTCFTAHTLTPVSNLFQLLYIDSLCASGFVLKAVKGLAPAHISSLLTPYVPARALRSSNELILVSPRSSLNHLDLIKIT